MELFLSLASQGFIIVIILTFSFGPAFFALINAGIREGFKEGALLAFGIVLSDLILSVLISFLLIKGAESYLSSAAIQKNSALVGGIILIIFGITYFLKKKPKTQVLIENKKGKSIYFLIVKGFLLNLFNPAVWFLWLANATAIGITFEYSFFKMFLFFVVVLIITFAIELSKVFLAGKIKHLLTDKMMHRVNIVTGIALVAFGVYLIFKY